MKRLQTKCIIVSAGLHLLLVVILIVGPAFLTSKSKVDDMKTLDFVPSLAIDEAFSHGGNPNAQPPPPTPTPTPPAPPVAQPAPPPPPSQPVRQQEPASVPVRQTKPDPEAIEPEKSTVKRHEIKLTPVVRHATNDNSRQPSESDRRTQELTDIRRRAAEAIGRTARSLSHDLSPSTTIDTNPGEGGGGEAYANYGQIVKSIYEREWIAPEDVSNDDAITKVTVTIARDGTVMSSRIVRGSGDSSVDGSVQRTLDRVTFIMPFPEGSKDRERTYTINFNLKTKRLAG
jgi:TonB family protein